MEYFNTVSTVLSILTAVITGGFVLVFVEIGNRKNRLNDTYNQIMSPFMKKFSAYCRFVNWVKNQLIYSKEQNDYEKHFKKLINQIGKYGYMLIMSGGDYPVHQFSANELNDVALDVNNIWYWHDKMHPCKIKWEQEDHGMKELINKELNKVNPLYISLEHNVDLIAKVSGDFYVDIYQQIEYETYKYETYNKMLSIQTVIVTVGVVLVLLLLSIILFFNIPAIALKWSTLAIILLLIICLLMLGIDIRKQVVWRYSICSFFSKIFKKLVVLVKSNLSFLCKLFKRNK